MSAKRITQSESTAKHTLPAFKPPAKAAGLPLDELGRMLASRIESGVDPYAAAPAAAEDFSADLAASEADDACPISPRSILEAMLFVGQPDNEPWSSQQLADQMKGVRPAEIDEQVRLLNEDYASRNCPYTIVTEAKGYRLALLSEHARIRDRFYGRARQSRLSQAAIEVLAVAAYNGPVTAEDVARLRGKPSGHVLTQLVRRELLKLERKGRKKGRIEYQTTSRFLALFGLKSLDELPKSGELEER